MAIFIYLFIYLSVCLFICLCPHPPKMHAESKELCLKHQFFSLGKVHVCLEEQPHPRVCPSFLGWLDLN